MASVGRPGKRTGTVGRRGKKAGPVGRRKDIHGSALTTDQNKTKVLYPTTTSTTTV